MYSERTRTCFVVSPIGSPGSEIRDHADRTLAELINPVVQGFGFAAVRGDQIAQPGIITDQVVHLLLNSHLVIADLTFGNPNVFYELAIRHMARKPAITLIRADQSVPYDARSMRTITFGLGSDKAIFGSDCRTESACRFCRWPR